MSTITAVVATYGAETWRAMGDKAAEAITEVPVIRLHRAAPTLAQVRNMALNVVDTEYVCFIDGDDSVEAGYFDRDLSADIIVTPLDGVFPTVNSHAHQCQPECLPGGNYIHIGAIARAETLRALGGFREHLIYEDWDLWLRAHYAGSTFTSSPGPSYRTRVFGQGSRNTALPLSTRKRVRADILRTATNPTGAS